MIKMGLNEIREKYLSFFEGKDHMRLPSFSLVPRNDPSVLLINAGMTPMKPFFTGAQIPPAPRVTSCQKCIRVIDIENVGKTSRHGTFFEMLGNFSFGDYFKKEAIEYAWDFLVNVLEVPRERLYVSVYREDDEAYDIWEKEIGLEPDRIVRLGKEDNFWEHGTGPCGPCSEIHFDRGPGTGCGKPECTVGCDCDRYVEIWNLVFTQFNKEEDGTYTPLEKCNIDTGGGIERFAAMMQGVDSLFEVDTIRAILDHACEITGTTYGASTDGDMAIRVITDHIRSVTFMISDGILPSNEGRGYVMRRLIRRAARFGRNLGVNTTFLHNLVDTVVRESGSAYPELERKKDAIRTIVRVEEDRFAETVQAGTALLDRLVAEAKKTGSGQIAAKDAFQLHDTFGFPLHLTLEIAAENGLSVDEPGFEAAMLRQKEMARNALKGKTTSAWTGEETPEALAGLPPTVFTGYDTLEDDGHILALLRTEDGTGASAEEAHAGQDVVIVTDTSPLYAESGGQSGDTGVIRGDGFLARVSQTTKTSEGVFLHAAHMEEGTATPGGKVRLEVDRDRRLSTARNHTVTHILHKALRTVLGEHVSQSGSSVTPERLRFDFSHFQPLTAEERESVENRVNRVILSDLPVRTELRTMEEARQSGAMALFEEKYGDHVRVVHVGDYSDELCGGTHLHDSSQACLFRIVSESGVAAGVRRIEAITGEAALSRFKEESKVVSELADILKSAPADLVSKIEGLVTENHMYSRQSADREKESLFSHADKLIEEAEAIGPFRAVVAEVPAPDADTLRQLADRIRDRIQNGIVFLTARSDGKVLFVSMATPDAVKAGIHAGNLAREAAKTTGGGGGGRPDMAQAGGKNPKALDKAIQETKTRIREQLS